MTELFTEGLQEQELRDLVHNEIHIDEFQAKMNSDDQIVVVSFKVKYQPSAADLESFLEKGYDFILDAETSKSEFENGWYLVYAEFERRLDFPDRLLRVLDDLKNITNAKNWIFTYGPSKSRNVMEWPVDVQNLTRVVPLSPKRYRDLKAEQEEEDGVFANLKDLSGINTQTVEPELPADIGEMVELAGLPINQRIGRKKNIGKLEYVMRDLAGITTEGVNTYERLRR